ncbi:MAG: O-antigen ligase family protein [Chloroflexi bacterium]|nr:O-antigen ligase family protein [Chloroflexota bacterium]
MKTSSDLAGRAVVILLCSIILIIGATFNSILNPELGAFVLAVMTLTAAGWWLWRRRRGWRWFRAPLDAAFALWALAFGLALLANLDAWRRIAIGLWYVGVYVGVWYVLLDALANGGIRREMLADGVLVGGAVVNLFGVTQVAAWAGAFGLERLPRPVSVFGNPNFLGAFLVVLIPLALSRAAASRSRVIRVALGFYVLLSLALLFLTFSRGAWVGLAAGGALWLWLMLRAGGQFSLRSWWRVQPGGLKAVWLAGGAAALIAAALASILLIRSLTAAGRDVGLRTELYAAAAQLFAEKPLTGHGLFTYGRGLVRLPGIEPDKPHSHAHNIVLQIAAETGLPGLAALAVTLALMARAVRANWKPSPPDPDLSPIVTGNERRRRIMLAGAGAAVVAFGVHQLTDVPAMMPAIALTGLIALVLAVAPAQPQPMTARWRLAGHPVGVMALWVLILVSGWWSNRVYNEYLTALRAAADSGDYRGAAERLQPVINAAPNLSLYPLEQGFLYGMAAAEGDADAARAGSAAYQRFLALDPGYALAWANLAALCEELGETERALEAWARAAELDPEIWPYAFNLGQAAEAAGDPARAEAAYRDALRVYPDAILYPEWDDSALRASLGDIYAVGLSAPAMTVVQLVNGRLDNARLAWEDNILPDGVQKAVIGALLDGDLNQPAAAERIAITPQERAWVHAGRAWMARMAGDEAGAARETAAARQQLTRGPLDTDDTDAINIAYGQFLRLAIPRWFLPGVYYPVDDAALVYLIENT